MVSGAAATARTGACSSCHGSSDCVCVSCAAAGGSSLATRKAAAAQIAGIATAHPAQLPAVLAAVSRHLRHREWDARAAAGHCLGLLAEHFGHHTSAELQAAAAAAAVKLEQEEVTGAVATAASGAVVAGTTAASTSEEQAHLLSFRSFDVQQVVAQGTPMLASGGEVRLGSGTQLACACSPAAPLPAPCACLPSHLT